MKALEIKRLVKYFEGVKALDGVTLDFERGKITSVIGPNGSGKTTFINVLSGMTANDGGAMVIAGSEALKKVKAQEVAGLGITRTFQEVRLFEQMTVLDNILVVLTRRGVWGALFERREKRYESRAEEVLRRVGLWEKRKQLSAELSYGQRKLLEIARVAAMDTEIVLLDEPFAGLFPEMVKLIVEIVKEMRQEGKTVILVEHNMNLIRELSDYLFVLDSGKLLAEGGPEEVLEQPEVIEAYLGM